ncbi:hypothetical protein JCM10213_000095 [Rhodosporidiobolus nylandii]
MPLPASADPAPETNPTRTKRRGRRARVEDESGGKGKGKGKGKMGTFQLLSLTVAMGGAQLVSSIQGALGLTHYKSSYGTSYLLQLGLSTQSTALVWLAGPVAGAVVQPVVAGYSGPQR